MSTINSSGFFNFNNSMLGTSSAGSNLLGDWMSIRNGSYKRLLKAYYANEKSSSKTNSSSSKDNKVESAEVKKLNTVKSDASSLKTAANALNNKDLFEKVTKVTKDENGEDVTTTDYDRDAIYSAVKNFVDAYNSTLDSASSQDNLTILRKAATMTKSTSVNQNTLRDVGITIGKDNKLSVNEEKLKNADIGTLKTLFSGYGSFASNVANKASDIATMADQLAKSASRSNASLYTNSGNYSSYSSSNAFDKFF